MLSLLKASFDAAARLAAGGETSSLMTEMSNRVEAFSLFENVESILGAGSASLPLDSLFSRAAGQGPYRSAWLIEGAAHLYARNSWKAAEPTGAFAAEGPIAAVPHGLYTVAHVGLAAVIAERVLGDVAVTGLDGAVNRFHRLCRANAYPGYDDMCVELFGFVVSMLSPGLTNAAARATAGLFEGAEDFFWHGAGRAAYFSTAGGIPVPGAHARAIRRIDSTLPHARARANATAGWAWALTLVNIRHPEIVRAALDRARAASNSPDAVTEGAGSGLRIWVEINPGDELAARHGMIRRETTPVRDLFRYLPGRC